jgi:hypothetical protein
MIDRIDVFGVCERCLKASQKSILLYAFLVLTYAPLYRLNPKALNLLR